MTCAQLLLLLLRLLLQRRTALQHPGSRCVRLMPCIQLTVLNQRRYGVCDIRALSTTRASPFDCLRRIACWRDVSLNVAQCDKVGTTSESLWLCGIVKRARAASEELYWRPAYNFRLKLITTVWRYGNSIVIIFYTPGRYILEGFEKQKFELLLLII